MLGTVEVRETGCGLLFKSLRQRDFRLNLLVMTIIWTASGFTYYLLEFYVKYFPGNVFFNKALFGVADACSILAIKFL